MPPQLRLDGFYQTGAKPWEEWHAGVRMHGVRFHYVRFYRSGDWLGCYRDAEFDFWSFSELLAPELFAAAKQLQAPTIVDGDPLCQAGTFVLRGIDLTKVMRHSILNLEWQYRYKVFEDRLLAETGIEWRFEKRPNGS